MRARAHIPRILFLGGCARGTHTRHTHVSPALSQVLLSRAPRAGTRGDARTHACAMEHGRVGESTALDTKSRYKTQVSRGESEPSPPHTDDRAECGTPRAHAAAAPCCSSGQ